jgi:hypothetical protein
VVREIVSIGGVETMVQIPGFDDPDARRIIAILAAITEFERTGKLAPVNLLGQVAGQYIITHGAIIGRRDRSKNPDRNFRYFADSGCRTLL